MPQKSLRGLRDGGEDETIAFGSTRDANTDIYLVTADGDDLRRVTTASAEELEPCWSPERSRRTYPLRRPAWRLYSSLPDGLDERVLTSAIRWSPSWSPDGLSVAYSTGSSIRRVFVLTGEADVLVPSCGNCGRPAWSPDGTRVVFRSERDGNLEIYTTRSDGPDVDVMRITHHPAADMLPAWSPSGEWIAFVTDRDGNHEIYVMKPDGSSLRRLTDNPGDDTYPAWRPEG